MFAGSCAPQNSTILVPYLPRRQLTDHKLTIHNMRTLPIAIENRSSLLSCQLMVQHGVCIHHCPIPNSKQLCQKWLESHYQFFLGSVFFLISHQFTINSNHDLVSHLTPHTSSPLSAPLDKTLALNFFLFSLFLAHPLAHLLRLLPALSCC